MKDTQQFIKSKLHILKMSNLNIGFSDTVGNKTGSNILERKKTEKERKAVLTVVKSGDRPLKNSI